MTETVRIQVLIDSDIARRFESYCRDRGFKKSTLIARLIRDHLDNEHYGLQRELFRTEESERS
jgi:metal-responsive CopG/Arc/MetJ family transcriptional regulator